MNGFEKRAEKKKQDILVATEKLFCEKGSSNLTVKEIAKSAHVSPVTIFKFFDTKSNLIEETLLNYTKNLMIEIEKIVYSSITFQDKIKKFMFLKSNMAKNFHKEFYATFSKYISDKNERFISVIARNKKLTQMLFEQGKKEGVINKNLSNDALEVYIQLISESIYSNNNISKVIPLADDIMDLIYYGLAGKPN